MSSSSEYRIEVVDIDTIKPSPENDDIYNGVNLDRKDFQELVSSIRSDKIKEPLHITEDNFILSGHRRYAAAVQIGLTRIPVIRQPVRRFEYDRSEYRKLLAD